MSQATTDPLGNSVPCCRAEFPALDKKVNGNPVVFLDGPGGTQVPRRVSDRITRYLLEENANVHGATETSRATDRVIDEGRRALADFLGASADEIAFGQNMTTLNFALSRALGRRLGPGDEIVITELDHEGNRGPWLALEEKGVVVRQVKVDVRRCTLDLDDLRAKVNRRTRVVAVGGASNGVGTVNDLELVVSLAREVGAVSVVDAVHLAPHKPIDVRRIGCDFLLASAYKFFGPHLGVLYGRRDAFERLEAYKLRPQSNAIPSLIETGTLNHEGIAGAVAAIDFLADLGRRVLSPAAPLAAQSPLPAAPTRREALRLAMAAIDEYEMDLAYWFMAELRRIKGLVIYGPPEGHPRTPTISVRLAGKDPAALSEMLAGEGVFTAAGSFYALTLFEKLGLEGRGGALRMGLAPYNTRDELERTLDLLRRAG